MKNNYLVIPSHNLKKKSPNVDFLFPLKGYCVGFKKEYTLEEIDKNSYVYINRLLDSEKIESLKKILPELEKQKGIVFEDLGVLELIKEEKKNISLIFYATHANCSKDTINALLDYVDSIVISPDITTEEIKEILKKAKKKVCLYTFGPIPYMYSRRTLLKNYQEEFSLERKNELELEETSTNKKFVFIENEYGTVVFDEKKLDGRIFLNEENISYHLLNLDWEEIEDLSVWIEEFEKKLPIKNTTDGFLNQKTIYRLPPRKES